MGREPARPAEAAIEPNRGRDAATTAREPNRGGDWIRGGRTANRTSTGVREGDSAKTVREPNRLEAVSTTSGAPRFSEPVTASPEYFVDYPGPLERPTAQTLSLMLVGGGALGVSDSPIAQGTATVEWGLLEPWALALDFGLDSPRNQTLTEGDVQVYLQWASLLARRSFFARGVDGLHVSLGAQLVHLGVSANGFPIHNNSDVFTAGATLNAEWRQTLTSGLFLLVRLNVQARLRPQSFTVVGIGSVLTIPPWGFGLQAGVGWNFL
jgi:hypothetical protein